MHEGTVTLDDAKLTALFNTYIFGYRNAPLRKLAVSAGDGVIHLQGEMQRDGWVPFSLTGTLAIRDGSQLVFHPTGVRVSGINAQPVMRAANVKMADLLKVQTPIAQLAGDDLVMSVDKLMPPPRLKLTITALRVTPAGNRPEARRRHACRLRDARERAAASDVHSRRRREVHALDADERGHPDRSGRFHET